jgi:CRP/FNR family transcriptional regulator, cyclic AMP receptor protein
MVIVYPEATTFCDEDHAQLKYPHLPNAPRTDPKTAPERTDMDEAQTLGAFIAARGRKVRVRSGEVLFREGDVSSAVYAVISGRINLFITTPTGRELILGFKVPVQGFGELSAIDAGPRSASAVAMESTLIAQMTGDEFLDELQHVPVLSLVVLRELAEQLRALNTRISARTSDHTPQRVGQLLIELGVKFRRHSPTAGRVVIPVSQEEVAAWVGSTREATSRALALFRTAGAVETGRNRIVIADGNALLQVMRASADSP